MVIIKSVSAKEIFDSRKEKTILVSINTNVGIFSASSPNGKSTGKYAAKIYKKDIEQDIKTIKKFSDYFSKEIIENFDDLRRIEDIINDFVGANTLFAFESAILKALAKSQKKEIWELINSSAKNFPRLVGNCIGGGKHSKIDETPKVYPEKSSTKIFTKGKKPDFQEFLLIPNSKSVKESFEINKKTKNDIQNLLKKNDKNFKNKKNDEDAWIIQLNEKEIFEILKTLRIPIGTDIAASTFYKRRKYNYENPMLKRDSEEQINYLVNLIKNFDLFYIEDPFNEEDFESFSKLLKQFPKKLIIGDDLTVTNYKRLKKAIEMKSINGIIVKPNQIGSLLEVKEVCELAKKNNIKIIFSHRSGETEENILADLAFGFQADFFKSGITGKEREVKIKRLIEIEGSLNK
jgi:enolase